jgi:hypothetical protein
MTAAGTAGLGGPAGMAGLAGLAGGAALSLSLICMTIVIQTSSSNSR